MIIQQNLRFEQQVNVARDWWLRNRDKAPEAFDEEIERAFKLLLNAPHLGRPLRSRHGKLIRRLTLERIRYYLYYRVENDIIRLLSLWHTSRRPPRL